MFSEMRRFREELERRGVAVSSAQWAERDSWQWQANGPGLRLQGSESGFLFHEDGQLAGSIIDGQRVERPSFDVLTDDDISRTIDRVLEGHT